MTRQTYGALCALANQHGVKMTEEVRSFVRAVEQADAGGTPIELLGVKETTEEGGGQWRTCTGCYESEDGHPVGRYPYSDVMGCTLGGGCAECGGIGAVWDTTDYNAMADWLAARDGQNVAAGAEMQAESPQSQAAQGNTVVVGVTPNIKSMVDRFLGWRLPDDFAPDCGISFTPLGHPNGWPVGTNLLTAAQAEAMFLHALGVSGEPPHAECPPPLDATEAAEREHMGCAHCRTGIYAQQHCINCGLNVSPSCDCHRGRAARKISQQDPEPIYQVVAGEDPDIWRDVTAAEYGERLPSSRRRMYFAPKAAPKCWCYICNKDRMEYGVPYVMTHMIVCPSCGNKRCPRATDHRVACTNSNEPGQPGSRY